MKGSQYILIGGMGLLIVCSCANNEKWNDIHTVKVAGQAKAEKTKKATCNGDTITTPSYDITVDMEFIDTSSVENIEACRHINNQLIEEFLNQQEQSDGQKAVNIFIERLQNEYEQEEMAPEIYDHYIGKVEYGKDGVINYILDEDFYGGGAHPSQIRTILRFNAMTGNKIGLYEFFTDTCTNTLCNKLTQRLMDNLGVQTLDSLHSLGYLEMLDMFVTENFSLQKDSISFYYNQYDIAPYACGPSVITFSYDELEELIRK